MIPVIVTWDKSEEDFIVDVPKGITRFELIKLTEEIIKLTEWEE